MKEIPEKWYVLYSSREEFNIINDHFKKNGNIMNQYMKMVIQISHIVIIG